MRGFLFWLSGRLPCKIIHDNGQLYLERYYLFTVFGTRFYLHRFMASDPDCGLHSHPWRWALSIILAGWYWEINSYGTERVRWFNFLVGDSFHHVVLPLDRGVNSVWTLFIHRAERAKSWGFLRDKGQIGMMYVPHKPGPDDAWWIGAPRGRYEVRRMPRL
ncbi:hypothetical protein [Paraburkholderia sp. RL17-337-BIB-A]|uniref:hypothetical protein n=1 Tax=Paraburkholderia sp. RL17-337-BIB-A TaxID=3031636 RepID=UPI0038BA8B47